MIIDGKEVSAETGYADGYTCGYEWLSVSRQKNPLGFKHPSEPGGYKPGGPGNFYYQYLDRYINKNPNPKWKAQDDYNRAWHKGWVDGINKYVAENNLPFSKVN